MGKWAFPLKYKHCQTVEIMVTEGNLLMELDIRQSAYRR